MGLPHITTFCWCMGLEVGSKVIGYVHLLVSLGMMVVCSLSAASARQYVGTVEDAVDHDYSRWYAAMAGLAASCAVHALLAVALLVAVHKRHTLALRVWVWAMLLLCAAAVLYALLSTAVLGARGSGSDIFIAFLEGALVFGIIAYCILCVHSYSLVLKCSEDMVGPNKTEY